MCRVSICSHIQKRAVLLKFHQIIELIARGVDHFDFRIDVEAVDG